MKKMWKPLLVCAMILTMLAPAALADVTLMTNDTTNAWWPELEAIIEESTEL